MKYCGYAVTINYIWKWNPTGDDFGQGANIIIHPWPSLNYAITLTRACLSITDSGFFLSFGLQMLQTFNQYDMEVSLYEVLDSLIPCHQN